MGDYLSHLTWQDVKSYLTNDDMVIIPTGSCEQHGSHLPLGTDYMIAESLADRLKNGSEILVCPTLQYGHSSNHERFPGTISIKPRTYRIFLEDLVFSLFRHGFRKYVFLNGHSGNTPLLQEVCNLLRDEGGFGCIIDWWELAGVLLPEYGLTGHGDALECSAIMSTHPDLVTLNSAAKWSPKRLTKNISVLSWQKIRFEDANLLTWLKTEDGSDSGNFGSLEGSSAKRGDEVLDRVAEFLIRFLEELKTLDLSDLKTDLDSA